MLMRRGAVNCSGAVTRGAWTKTITKTKTIEPFTVYRLPITEKEVVLDGTASFVFCQHELKHEPLGRWP